MGVKLYINSTILDSAKDMIDTIDNSDFLVDNIVVVPDKFSLQMEKLLLDTMPSKALFNVRVLGITELASEILKDENDDILSTGESLLLTQKAIENVKKDLLAFNKTNINFCYEINKIIMQLKSSLVGGDDLNEGAKGLSGIKFHDLKLIFNEYEKLRTKNDANSRLSLASQRVKSSNIFKNTKLYFAGFDAFTKEAYTLLKSLIVGAKELNISLAKPYNIGNEYIYEKDILQKIIKLANECGGHYEVIERKTKYFPQKDAIIKGLYSFDNCHCTNDGYYTLLSASSLYEETLAVAKIIYHHITKGYKFSDFSVMVSDLSKYENYIESIFETFDIPYFIDTAICGDQTILAKVIFEFLNVINSHYSSQSLNALFSDLIIGKDEELISKIELFEINNKNKYKKYISKDNPYEDILIKIEKCKTAGEFGDVIKEILKRFKERFSQVLDILEEKKYLKEKNINSQAEQVLQEALDLMSKYESEISVYEYTKKLKLLLSFKEVLTVPTFTDGIFVGDATASSLLDNRIVFVLGGEKLPIVCTDNGFLSDEELVLNYQDKQIEPTIRMINRRNRFKLFNLLTKANEKLIISYQVMNEEERKNELPSYITSLNKIFGIDSIDRVGETFNYAYTSGNFVALGNRKAFLQDYYRLLSDSIKKELNIDKLNLTIIDKKNLKSDGEVIFFKNKIARVTQLEQYFSCPFKHFVNYGLRLKEKEKCEFEVKDIGNVCHRGAELFVKQMIKNKFEYVDVENFVNDNFVKILEDEKLLEKFYELTEKSSLENYLKKHLCSLLNDIKKEMNVSAFRPKYLEKKFQTMKVGDKKITLVGKVDRIDECGDYFRIIDYKTGTMGGLLKELYYGNKLQLFLYQKVVGEELRKKSAGVFYFSAKLEYLNNGEDDKKILKGLTQNDKEIIPLLDNGIDVNGSSSILSISLSANRESYKGSSIAKQSLSVYENYAKAIADKAVNEICGGFIESKPDENACEWCPYSSLCLYERTMGIRKKKNKIGEFNSEK